MSAPGMISVEIGVEEKNLERMLHGLDIALNPQAIAGFLLGTVDPYFRERARSRFASEGDDMSGPWAPLRESTQSFREQGGYGASHPINRREGELEAYIVDAPSRIPIDPMGASLIMPGDPPTGELRTKVETAQQGKASPRTVARPILGMNERDLAFVLNELAMYITHAPSMESRGAF